MLRLKNANLGAVVYSRSAGGISVAMTRYAPQAQLPMHEHGDAYLCLVADGAYRQSGGGSPVECRRGMLMVHPEGHRHADRFGDEGARCLNIHFDPALAGDVAIRRLLSDYRQLHSATAVALQSRIERELASTDDAAPLALCAATFELIAWTCRQFGPASAPAWLTRVFERLHDHPAAPASLAELAAIAGVHPAHLARSFHHATGFPVGEYLRRLRIRRACEALTRSHLPVAAIALDAGFADQSHFSRVFRRVTGETPRTWRQRTQNPS